MRRVVLCAASVLLAASLSAGEAATLDTDPHLMAWWKFDETEGTKAADASAHARHGVLEGGLTFAKGSVEGRVGKALQFGAGGVVRIPGYKGVTGTQARTVAAWIKTTRPQGELCSWGAEEFGAKWVFGHIRGRVGVSPHGGYYYMNPETHDGKWHHVVIVLAAAETPNLHDHAKVYKDGAPAQVHDIGLLDLWPIKTGDQLEVRIGNRFEGAIDDLRVYDRPLADDEVKALFELKSDKPLPKKG